MHTTLYILVKTLFDCDQIEKNKTNKLQTDKNMI